MDNNENTYEINEDYCIEFINQSIQEILYFKNIFNEKYFSIYQNLYDIELTETPKEKTLLGIKEAAIDMEIAVINISNILSYTSQFVKSYFPKDYIHSKEYVDKFINILNKLSSLISSFYKFSENIINYTNNLYSKSIDDYEKVIKGLSTFIEKRIKDKIEDLYNSEELKILRLRK